jgi:exosome complex exonuclease DIS3/RRP44
LIPPVFIDTRAYTTALNNKVICSIVRWPADSWLPQGTLIRVIGDIGKRDVEDEVILLEHDVRFRPFTTAERSELPKGEWKPANPLESYRVDLTYLDICSVDPPGCTDIDDALHFRQISKGLYEVGVHIADVSHFVRAGCPLDLEASRRCTSVSF